MSVSLKCEIDANPMSAAKWHRDADTSHSNTSLPQLETNKDGSLNFSSISKNDTGWYRCTTQHEFGSFASFGYFLNVRTTCEYCINYLRTLIKCDFYLISIAFIRLNILFCIQYNPFNHNIDRKTLLLSYISTHIYYLYE
jgi:hypothetical protein